MRLSATILVPILVLAMVGIADAKGVKRPAATTIKGKIESITNGTLTLRSGKRSTAASKTVVRTTVATQVSVNGVAGKKISDLLPGQSVVITVAVTADSGAATTTNATTTATAVQITATNPLPRGRHVTIK